MLLQGKNTPHSNTADSPACCLQAALTSKTAACGHVAVSFPGLRPSSDSRQLEMRHTAEW